MVAAIAGATVTAWLVMPATDPKLAITQAAPIPVVENTALKLEIKNFLDTLYSDARAKGISSVTLEKALAGFTPDDEIANLNATQPEHIKTAADYVGLLVSDTRIANGRLKLAEHTELLARIEQRYGVDKHVLVAIWGIESAYGTSMGERAVVRSLATLAMTDTRRPAFWRGELLSALAVLERGDITVEKMTGSWAGAMGHTQFIPTTYTAHAVDFDGDGRRDIWTNPADALASTANYLKVSGWVPGHPAFLEVKLPTGFDYALTAPGTTKLLPEWLSLGIVITSDRNLPDKIGNLSLTLPAGANGPAFLTGGNFRAVLRYNRAVPYALAVSHLAERLAGGAPFAGVWPADDKALSKTEREELQTRLLVLGHSIGQVDGIIGSGSRAAIRAFQKTKALAEDGHPNLALLQSLRLATATMPNEP
jgi:membrane-bound lytic murein transglycosylase B